VLHEKAIHIKNWQEHTINSLWTSNHPSNKTYQKLNAHMHCIFWKSQNHQHPMPFTYSKPNILALIVFRRTYLQKSISHYVFFALFILDYVRKSLNEFNLFFMSPIQLTLFFQMFRGFMIWMDYELLWPQVMLSCLKCSYQNI
jgi:hypothetical protein